MVAYTLATCPDLIINLRGKDTDKARKQAMEQLYQMMENDEIPADAFPDGVSAADFIEVDTDTLNTPTAVEEEELLQAVQTLSALALLKLDLEKERQAAIEIYQTIDRFLFGDGELDEAEVEQLKKGFKTLKGFAQNYVKLQAALPQAKLARDLIKPALSLETPSEATAKATS